jgi:hypothetical protein
VGVATCIKTAQRRGMNLRLQRAATASWRREKKHIPPTTTDANMPKKSCGRRNRRGHSNPNLVVFSSNPVKPHLSFAAALRGQANNQPHQEVAVTTNITAATKTKEQATAL